MRVALVVAVGAFVLCPVSAAQTDAPLPRQELLDRSEQICANALDAALPHLRRMRRAETIGGVLRHGRRFVRTLRPYVRRLGDLRAASEPRRYRTFAEELRAAVYWLDRSLDALSARRGRLAKRRADISGEHAQRAERAARRYPLRQACIVLVS